MISSGLYLLIVPGLIWGASFLFVAEGLRSVGPNGIAFLRIAIGFAVLSLFPSARAPVDRRDWAVVAVIGVFWFAFPLSLFPYAQRSVSSAMTGMLNGAIPLFSVIVASLIARRPPGGTVLQGLAVGITGVVLLAVPGFGEGKSTAAGIAMILVALASIATALNLAARLQQSYGGPAIIWRAQAVGMTLTAPLGMVDVLHARWLPVPALCLAALGALGTGIAYMMVTAAAGRFGAARASATTFITPVVALILGVTLRGERVEAISVAGCFVCLAGAWMMNRSSGH